MDQRVCWFGDLRRGDTAIAGGKGANLGEMVSAGFPTPPGFVVTADTYVGAMERAGVRGRLVDLQRGADLEGLESIERSQRKRTSSVDLQGEATKMVIEAAFGLGFLAPVASHDGAPL